MHSDQLLWNVVGAMSFENSCILCGSTLLLCWVAITILLALVIRKSWFIIPISLPWPGLCDLLFNSTFDIVLEERNKVWGIFPPMF